MPEDAGTADAVHWLRGWASTQLGLALPADQPHLLEGRVSAFADSKDITVDDLASAIRRGDSILTQGCVDVLTTNETSWFRDPNFFAALGEMLASWPDGRQLSVWSSASSSGQELYSTAMLARELLPASTQPPILVGSDLSSAMVSRARSARYAQPEVNKGLPAKFLVKYFHQEGLSWQLAADVRASCRFFVHNVVKDTPPGLFDVVLCRYLLIYFDSDTRYRVLDSLASCLKPGGFIALGASEMLGVEHPGFERRRFGSGWVYARV